MRIEPPGSEFGCCIDPECGHLVCGSDRRIAQGMECMYCGRPIGFGVEFHEHDVTSLFHVDCYKKRYPDQTPGRGRGAPDDDPGYLFVEDLLKIRGV